MRDRARALLLGLAFVSISLPGTPGAATAEGADKAAQELLETVSQLNALNRWFSEAERKRASLMSEVKEQDSEIADLNKTVLKTQSILQQIGSDLAELGERQKDLASRRNEQARLIGDHLAAAYRLSGQDFFKQLLNQESPDKFDRLIRYHRYFSEARLEMVQEFQDTLAAIEQTNAELEDRRVVQTRQHAELVEEQARLATERDARAKLIAQLDHEKETKSQEHDRLEQNRQRLEALVDELRRRATELDGSAFVAAKGHLPMPVAGNIRHAFGQKRADGRLEWHGLDISAPHGTPVTAIFRGRVVFSDWLRGFGLLTILDHGSGYMTLYGNVDVLHKKVGDWVESGEMIAGAGNSGGKKNPGVYFEVRHKGQPKDPITWVAR